MYALATRGMKEERRAQFDFELEVPPAWEVAEPTPESLEADAAAWGAAAASFQALKQAPTTL